MSLLAIKNLSLDIGKTPILRDVSLSIAKGKIFGTSALLKVLTGVKTARLGCP